LNKSKMIILAVVVMAVVAIFLFSSSNQPGPSEEVETDDRETIDTAEKAEDLTEFKPADNPYAEYIRARENKKPIVLEFYARW
jgi:uncharacterized membrane protein